MVDGHCERIVDIYYNYSAQDVSLAVLAVSLRFDVYVCPTTFSPCTVQTHCEKHYSAPLDRVSPLRFVAKLIRTLPKCHAIIMTLSIHVSPYVRYTYMTTLKRS